MKKNYIVALAIFSLYIGIGNYSKAQDAKPSFIDYVFKSPWIVEFGMSRMSNDGKPNPFDINMKVNKYRNLQHRINYFPARFAVEKYLFANNSKNVLKGFSIQGVLSIHGNQPIEFGALDLNVRYHFNKLFGSESSLAKWFDPYLAYGVGVTELTWYKVKEHPQIGPKIISVQFRKDRFLTMQGGVGSNFWINEVVGINIQAEAKWHWLERSARSKSSEGTNYTQYTVGLIFKIGRCKETPKVVEESKTPVSNYKRSKEEEDALIHLREHLNK